MTDRCEDNCIEWVCGQKDAYVTLSYNNGKSGLAKRIRTEAAAGNPEVKIISDNNEDGCLYARVPISWVKLSPPRQMSDEQKEAAGERLKKMREEST